jgi:hypothetical protein
MGLAHRPGLQLVHGVAGRVEVVVTGDLGKFGGMAAALALVLLGPGEELTVRARLARGVGGEGDGGHGASPADLHGFTLATPPWPVLLNRTGLHSS